MPEDSRDLIVEKIRGQRLAIDQVADMLKDVAAVIDADRDERSIRNQPIWWTLQESIEQLDSIASELDPAIVLEAQPVDAIKEESHE